MLAAMPSGSFLNAFAADLIDLEMGPLPSGLPERATTWVVTRMAGAGDVTRLGLALTGALIATSVRVRSGRAYAALPPERRRAMTARLAKTRLPLAAEYVRAVRALAVTYIYDALHATAP
jgi:hypothetical protein